MQKRSQTTFCARERSSAAWCPCRPTGDPGGSAAVLRSSTLCSSSLISHVTGVPRLQTRGCAACTGVPKPSPAAARASSRAAQPLPKRRARCTPVSSGKREAAACRGEDSQTPEFPDELSVPWKNVTMYHRQLQASYHGVPLLVTQARIAPWRASIPGSFCHQTARWPGRRACRCSRALALASI